MSDTALDPESLLRIPLVATAMRDERVQWVPRAADCNWNYKGCARTSVGFRPFDGRVFYGQTSRTAEWLRNPNASARPLNSGDCLVDEVLFLVHDYIHCWSWALIRKLMPELGFGTAEITADTRDAHAYALLVTEAAATVGLDIWHLCTIPDINEFVPIGSERGALTTRYNEANIDEYRRAIPGLNTQDPSFFVFMANLYCTGEWEGLDVNDLNHSPKLARWVHKELVYGEKQREYVRRWLAFLAGKECPANAKGPIPCGDDWQRQVTEEVGHALWRLVKQSDISDPIDVAPVADTWRRRDRKLDPCFCNLGTWSTAELQGLGAGALSRWDFLTFSGQYLQQFDFAAMDQDKLPVLETVLEARKVAPLMALMGSQPRVADSDRDEETDLFFLP